MSDNYVGEIRLFACNYAPQGWALCAGQLMSIPQNTALYALLGTNYGGDGRSSFALPNLQGYATVGNGQAASGTQYFVGETGGVASVTLLQATTPAHTHSLSVAAVNGSGAVSTGHQLAQAIVAGGRGKSTTGNAYTTTAPNATMAALTLGPSGGSQPHNNMQPYLTLNYCIALSGIYPPRS